MLFRQGFLSRNSYGKSFGKSTENVNLNDVNQMKCITKLYKLFRKLNELSNYVKQFDNSFFA